MQITCLGFFCKADRIAAWTLLLSFVLYVVTGYGMTKGIIDYDLARNLHTMVLAPIGFTAFMIHTFWAIHLAMKRWRVWNVAVQSLMIIAYTLIAVAAIYVNYFYVRSYARNSLTTDQALVDTTSLNTGNPAAEVPATTNTSSAVTPTNTTAPTTPTIPSFNATTLSKYNGRNGQPSYVAVDGKVYDVSSLFRNGVHKGWSAGVDLSSAFHDQHSASYLRGFPIVGTYK